MRATPTPPTRLACLGLLIGLALALICGCAPRQAAPSDPAANAAAERRALALLAQPRFQQPPGWQWGKMVNGDGAGLRYGWTQAEGAAKGTIILLPGFRSPAEEFFETARDFQSRGFDVWCLDRRGQGGSQRWLADRQKAYSIGFDHDERDLVQFVSQAVRPRSRGPLFIVAESFGGHIALRALHDHPGLVSAAAFSSPAIVIHTGRHQGDAPAWLMRLAADTAVAMGYGSDYARHQSDWTFNPDAGGASDPAKDDPTRALANQALFVRDPALAEGGATWAIVQANNRSSDLEVSPGWMNAIATPILIGEAPDDQIAVSGVMVSACHEMRRCTLIDFPHAKHALFNDSDQTRSAFIAAITQFFSNWPAPPAS